MRTFTITQRTETRHEARVTAEWLANVLACESADIEARTPDACNALTRHGLVFMENAEITTTVTSRCGVALDDTPLPGFEPTTTHAEREVAAVLNTVADDILHVTDAGDEGLRDAINLMVNAAGTYLRRGWREHDPATARTRLADVADSDYDEDNDLDTILGWIRAGTR